MGYLPGMYTYPPPTCIQFNISVFYMCVYMVCVCMHVSAYMLYMEARVQLTCQCLLPTLFDKGSRVCVCVCLRAYARALVSPVVAQTSMEFNLNCISQTLLKIMAIPSQSPTCWDCGQELLRLDHIFEQHEGRVNLNRSVLEQKYNCTSVVMASFIRKLYIQ